MRFSSVWLPSAALPPGNPDKRGLDAYDQHLACRPFPGALADAVAYVLHEAALWQPKETS